MLFNIIIKINNWIVKKITGNLFPNQIALLGPRCLQHSECRELVAADNGRSG